MNAISGALAMLALEEQLKAALALGHAARTRSAELQKLVDEERDRSDKLEAFLAKVAAWPELSTEHILACWTQANAVARDGTG